MPFLVGAYAAAPTDPASPEFTAFLDLLADHPAVGGLELPSHHLLDERIAALIAERGDRAVNGWKHVVTCFPGTMFALADDPRVGLASPSADGRAAAVAFVDRIRGGIRALVDRGGSVASLLLHSAPRDADPDALAASLAEIAGWDWNGTRLLLEHCDAASPDNPEPQKGFLTLEQELDVLAGTPDVGMVLNWGRSAIETRSPDGILEQIRRVRSTGRLTGLMFSGVAATDGAYGVAWADAHLPDSTSCPESLMTPEQITRAVHLAGDDVILGAKIGVQPADTDARGRVAVIDRLLAALSASSRQR